MCNRKLFIRGLARLEISLEGDQIDNLLLYCQELLKWNKRINLIARNTEGNDVLEKHFLDSLTLLPVIGQYGAHSATLLDVGTGAGFPGLVLAAARPDLQVTLVEPRQKRVSFLRHIIRTLRLTNVRVIEDRLEQAKLNQQDFTFITSRAVADADRFLAMLEGVSGPETLVIMMQAAEDSSPCHEGRREQSWQLVGTRKFRLPFSDVPRTLVMVRIAGSG